MTTYPVNERFLTFQGEGCNLGRPAYFIRLQGCDVRCTFCDSASTWHPDHKPTDIERMSAEALTEAALLAFDGAGRGGLVVLTGGEPTLHDLTPLAVMLRAHGMEVGIETAGHHPLPSGLSWVCVSPKPGWVQPLPRVCASADEIKIVVRNRGDIVAGLAATSARRPTTPVWLIPEWSLAQDRVTLDLISETVRISRAAPLRAGYQLHKIYGVDLGAPGARDWQGPLGGGRLVPISPTPPR